MNSRLSKWIKDEFKSSKLDLFAVFIERSLDLSVRNGLVAMITMQSWMFLSTYERLRAKVLNQSSIKSMIHLGSKAFDSIGGEVVSTTAFVLESKTTFNCVGTYFRLVDGGSETIKDRMFLSALKGSSETYSYSVNAGLFRKIPGNPIAYWASHKLLTSFSSNHSIDTIAPPRIGMMTTDNERFLRSWYELPLSSIGLGFLNTKSASESGVKWFPYNKGGGFRKWAGFQTLVVNWKNGGEDIIKAGMTSFRGKDFYFRQGLTWSDISTGEFSCRYTDKGYIFDIKGTSSFPSEDNIGVVATLLNSKVGSYILNLLNPTMSFQSGDIRRVPVLDKVLEDRDMLNRKFFRLFEISKLDWDQNEISKDFKCHNLIVLGSAPRLLSDVYCEQSLKNENYISEMKSIEESLNQYYIDVYDLANDLDAEVDIKNISLDFNPQFQFGTEEDPETIDKMALSASVLSLVSYSVGCMFGRYSPEHEGIYVDTPVQNIGSTFESFLPDEDNVIPIIDFEGDWFEDDIAERFKEFLKVTFGEEHFAENLSFIEEAIGKDIKKYFVKDFYADHVRRYKKRPIYWMFSSPKGSFNALIYMHRYQPDTVSIVLNDYLREFRTKLEARKESYEQVEISASASQKDKTNAIKAISKINKVLEEINDYEHDVLYPLAGEKIEIDLDDGVKHNYPLFGKALKKVTGLS